MSLLGDVANLFGKSGSKPDLSAPLSLVFKSAQTGGSAAGALSNLAKANPSPSALAAGTAGLLQGSTGIRLFNSYSFERNLLSPGAPFRFTAPGVNKASRTSIRSGDLVQVMATNKQGQQIPIATGIIDETDTHVTPTSVEYVLTGRDMLGQLIDNAVVDKNNRVVQTKNLSLPSIVQLLINNTRIPQVPVNQNMPGGPLQFSTNPGETKMNTLQRYLEFTNCLVWTAPNGQIVVGKPNSMKGQADGILTCGTSGAPPPGTPIVLGPAPQSTNVLDVRVRRSVNNAIRQIVVQLQDLNNVDAGAYTVLNSDDDIRKCAAAGVGRSVYEVFSYGEGANLVNTLVHVGNSDGNFKKLGEAMAQRVLARENVRILDCEVTLQGHLNSNGNLFDVDQVYYCNFPDDDVAERLYVYSVNFDLTLDHGMITKLRLCKAAGTLVAGNPQMPTQTTRIPGL